MTLCSSNGDREERSIRWLLIVPLGRNIMTSVFLSLKLKTFKAIQSLMADRAYLVFNQDTKFCSVCFLVMHVCHFDSAAFPHIEATPQHQSETNKKERERKLLAEELHSVTCQFGSFQWNAEAGGGGMWCSAGKVVSCKFLHHKYRIWCSSKLWNIIKQTWLFTTYWWYCPRLFTWYLLLFQLFMLFKIVI